MSEDCYQILGVEHDAPRGKIRAQYRLLARRSHPDLARSDQADDFSRFAQAYQVLGDPDLRQAYNARNNIFVEPRPLLPGQHSYQRLTVSAELAHTGGKAKLTYLLYEPCPRCWLSGCERCEGEGVLPEQVEIEVPIPREVKNAQPVFIEGYGSRSEPGGPRGDLFVYIYVHPAHSYVEQ